MLCITGHHRELPRSSWLRGHYVSTALSPEPYRAHGALGKLCAALGSLVLSVFSTSWGQIYALLCFALPVFIPKPTKTLFVLQSKSPMTWDPHFWAGVNWRHESARSSVEHAGGRWYINICFLITQEGKTVGKAKVSSSFFFFQKFKLMNGKNQQTSEILFDKQDFVLKKKK